MTRKVLAAVLGVGVFTLTASVAMAQSAVAIATAPVFSSCPDSTTNPEFVDTPCMGIAMFFDGSDSGERVASVRGNGAAVRFRFPRYNAIAVMIPNERAYYGLASETSVARIVADRRVRAFARPDRCSPWPTCKNEEPDDGGGSVQTVSDALTRIGAAPNDNLGVDGSTIVVAVVDTGVDLAHTDLQGNLVGGATCLGAFEGAISDDTDCDTALGGKDDHGHGTHVAGIIAAVDNSADTVGVAPNAKIMPVKVLDAGGYGYDSNILAGLDYALDNGADVVNMSLGGDGDCLAANAPGSLVLLRDKIAELIEEGVIVVVAAGNDRYQTIADVSPAGCPGVISVTSSTAVDGRSNCKRLPDPVLADTASFFTTDGEPNGRQPTIAAPGANSENLSCRSVRTNGVTSLAMGGGTTEMSGTSMASPHVAGVVALMLDKAARCAKTASPAAIAGLIAGNADLMGSAPIRHPYISQSFDGIYEGILDAGRALNAQGC